MLKCQSKALCKWTAFGNRVSSLCTLNTLRKNISLPLQWKQVFERVKREKRNGLGSGNGLRSGEWKDRILSDVDHDTEHGKRENWSTWRGSKISPWNVGKSCSSHYKKGGASPQGACKNLTSLRLWGLRIYLCTLHFMYCVFSLRSLTA